MNVKISREKIIINSLVGSYAKYLNIFFDPV